VGKRVEDLNTPAIDVINMGTIQKHGLLLPEIDPALSIEQRRPLLRDLAFQLEENVSPALLYFCDLQHHDFSSCLTVMPNLLSNRSATALAKEKRDVSD